MRMTDGIACRAEAALFILASCNNSRLLRQQGIHKKK